MTSTNLKAIVEQGYDAIAQKYHEWASPRPTETRTRYIERLGESLPNGAKVLELGCGAGIPATQQLIDQGFKVIGVDISSTQIALARAHVPSESAEFVQGDMMAIEFEQGTFDAIVGFYSLFHLSRDEYGPMLRKMTGWLKPGGWLLFNLRTEDGDIMRNDWMGAKMFSSGLGIEGNRNMLAVYGDGLTDVEDVVDVEYVGRHEEKFHWVCAKKR